MSAALSSAVLSSLRHRLGAADFPDAAPHNVATVPDLMTTFLKL
jgi:hypothetical protein